MRERGVAGVFVGGQGSRLGGIAKGLLRVPDSELTIAGHLASLAAQAGLRVVLVGAREEYASLGHPMLEDDPKGMGPMGGLAALLSHAGESPVVALACDMPHVDAGMLGRLLEAPDAAIVAPRMDGRWQPFFARYEPARVLPHVRQALARGQLSLQRVFDACGALELNLGGSAAALRDWDTPEDLARDGARLADDTET